MYSQFGQTPLHIAAGCGNYEIVKLLVNANSDVNATPKVMLPIQFCGSFRVSMLVIYHGTWNAFVV